MIGNASSRPQAPQTMPKKRSAHENDDRIHSRGAAHQCGLQSDTNQQRSPERHGGGGERVTRASELQEGDESHRGRHRRRAQIRNGVQDGHRHAPEHGMANVEEEQPRRGDESDGDVHGQHQREIALAQFVDLTQDLQRFLTRREQTAPSPA